MLGIVATLAPEPRTSGDRDTYEKTAIAGVVSDCHDVHCFRILVPLIVGRLPGPSLLKWKAYAVIVNAGAAVMLGYWCLILGFSSREASLATWIAAFGFGPLYTLFDCYTSDPLMFFLGPAISVQLMRNRRVRAGLLATIGVFAKEFAAAPLWIFMVWAALNRQWDLTRRLLTAALFATNVWAALHLGLMVLRNYGYGGNLSTGLFGGSYIATWVGVGPRLAARTLFIAFGALYILAAAGWSRASRDLKRLAIASAPAVLLLVYTQQPDRALWNFHFIVIPLAVLALQRTSNWFNRGFVACFAVANMRVGAQLPIQAIGRAALLTSITLAVFAVVTVRRERAHVANGPHTA